MKITEFLLARIAEDESDNGCYGEGEYRTCWERSERIERECVAKRRIVEEVIGWGHATCEDSWYSCAATYGTDVEDACCNDEKADAGCDCGLERRAHALLAPLASVYADHPDFDETWRL